MQILQLLRSAALALLLPLTVLSLQPAAAQSQADKHTAPHANNAAPSSPWLFVGFKKDSKDGIYYAISLDGYHWKLANGGKPVVPPTDPKELMRDPFIQRASDGGFRMVWTWSWYKPLVIGYSESKDLLTWTPHRQLDVFANEPTAVNVWAPALYYEPAQKCWLILWSSTIPGRFAGDDSGDKAGNSPLNHRIFSTSTKDFKSFTPSKLFFDPGYSVIDATILPPTKPHDSFVLIYKDERKIPLQKHLLTATGPSIEGPWSNLSQPISETWSEGAAIIPVRATADSPAGYLAYYDHYSQGQHYGAVFSPDLTHWTDALGKISFPAGMRHGSFVQITQAEYDRLNALVPDPVAVPVATPAAAPVAAAPAAVQESK
jgi:hypothetical protein